MLKTHRIAATSVALALSAMAVTGFLFAAKPGGGGGGNGGGGTGGGKIYFSSADIGFTMMNPDGSGKTPLPIGGGEPSRLLHAGHRWFLSSDFIADECYPNGHQRRELFARRDDGAVGVQLTTDAELEPYGGGGMRWEPGDVAVSWIARRWDADINEVVDAGVYEAELLFDVNGNITGLGQQPALPVVPAGLIVDYQRFLEPDMRSHDWSPDSSTIVSDRASGQELWLTDVDTGVSSRILQTTWATSPRWSPDGTRIAFTAQGVATINADGSNFKTIASGGLLATNPPSPND